jgi:phage gp29-like protein
MKKVFAKDEQKAPISNPLTKELDVIDSVFSMFYNMIPNPDAKVLAQGIAVYDKTLADPIVTGSTNTIKTSIDGLEYRIIVEDKNKKVVDLYYEVLSNLFKKELKNDILKAILFGAMYIDLIWGDYNGYLMPVDFSVKAHESFFYKKNNETKRSELYVKTAANPFDGELVPQYKVLVPRYEVTADNPYGKGLLANCYKSVFIKNNAWNFWSMFVEDHGTPKIDAEISSDLARKLKDDNSWTDEYLLAYIQDTVKTLRQNGVFTHFEGLKIQSLNSGKSDDGKTHNDLMNYCDMQNSILLLGHNGSSQATPGKLGNDTTALTILDIRRASYANFVANKINTLLQWIYEINFGPGKAPEIEFYEKSDVTTYKAKGELTQILTGCGVQFNDDYYQDEFNIDKKYFKVNAPAAPVEKELPKEPPLDKETPKEDAPEDSSKKKPKASAHLHLRADAKKDADADLEIMEQFGDYILESDDFKDADDSLINAIASFVSNAESYEDMLHNLYDLYPEMPVDGLKNVVTKLLLASRVYGNVAEGL